MTKTQFSSRKADLQEELIAAIPELPMAAIYRKIAVLCAGRSMTADETFSIVMNAVAEKLRFLCDMPKEDMVKAIPRMLGAIVKDPEVSSSCQLLFQKFDTKQLLSSQY